MTHGLHILAFVPAGGQGWRLRPSTPFRCRPAGRCRRRHRIVAVVPGQRVNAPLDDVHRMLQCQAEALFGRAGRAWSGAGTIDACLEATFDIPGHAPRPRMNPPSWPLHAGASPAAAARIDGGGAQRCPAGEPIGHGPGRHRAHATVGEGGVRAARPGLMPTRGA